jgi:hypothetical protein
VPRPAAHLQPPEAPSTIPTAPIPVPDNWTPAAQGRDRAPVSAHTPGFYDADGPATEVEHDEHGFPAQPDVPSTVVSEDDAPPPGFAPQVPSPNGSFRNSFDELPPGQALSALPNDAPTVVRPDLAGMADLLDGGGQSARPAAESPSNALPSSFDEQPAGEPTVALPPPSQRKKTQVKQPSPEPPPERLPSGASYSPPPDTPPPARKARSSADEKKPRTSRSRKPSAKSVKKPPAPGKKDRKSRSDRSESRKKLPKNASVEGQEAGGGIPMLYYVYGGVGVAGVALVAGAVVVAVVILAMTSG